MRDALRRFAPGRGSVVVLAAVLLCAGCDDFDGGDVYDTTALEVVGGEDVEITDFPWQVSLRSSWGSHFCGGSILNERWVLSAAHCLVQSSSSSVRVRAGVTRRSSQNGQDRAARRIYIYPGYNGATRGKDAALIELQQPLDLNGETVAAIPIVDAEAAAAGLTEPGTLAAVSGWGATSSSGGSPDVLQAVEMPIVSNDDAAEHYPWTTIGDDMLPVQAHLSGEGDKSPCYGDSGGPLVVADADGVHHLAGIVSWGQDCGGAPPAVYGRVSAFEEWIVEHAFAADE